MRTSTCLAQIAVDASLRPHKGVLKVTSETGVHDAKRTSIGGCASLLFELGVPLRMVMEILGHSQISTTSDIYTHVMPAQYREVAGALDAWLGGGDDDGQGDEDDPP